MSEAEHRQNRAETADGHDPETGRFLPGNCANPTGRPKGSRSLTALLRELLESETSDILGPDGKPMKWGELLVRMTLKNACKGNGACLKEAWERMDGKVPERHEVRIGGDWAMEPVETTTPPANTPEASEVADD